jgi:hypothetical protein
VRATLHEELMHDIGFETAYDEERRRRRRRATLMAHFAFRGMLVPIGLLALADLFGVVDLLPKRLARVVSIVAIVGMHVASALEALVDIGIRLGRFLGLLAPVPEPDERDEELVASLAAPGQRLDSVRVAEREPDPAPPRWSRLLLLPILVAIGGALTVPNDWWMLLGIVGFVCLVTYGFLRALEREGVYS